MGQAAEVGSGLSSIVGRIVDASNPTRPIGDTYIYVPVPKRVRASTGASFRQTSLKYAEAWSGPDGSYELTGLPNGRHRIVVEPPPGSGFAPMTLWDVDLGPNVSVPVALELRITVAPEKDASRELRIAVRPANQWVAPGAAVQYDATVVDESGADAGLAPTWLVTNGVGIIDENGRFTAGPESGPGIVSACVGWYRGATSVTVAGSGGGGNALNNSPTIAFLVSDIGSIVDPGVVARLSCYATDPDGDALGYSWACTGGSLLAGRSNALWIAPKGAGLHTVTCFVWDEAGALAIGQLEMTVLSGSAPGGYSTGVILLDSDRYIGARDAATVMLADEDLKGAGTVTVRAFSAVTDVAGETISLFETAAPGVFMGELGFARPFDQTGQTPLSHGDGLLGVYAEGGTSTEAITAVYEDAWDATGNRAQVTHTSTYEEPPSTVTGVVVDGITGLPVLGAVVEIYELGTQAVTRSVAGYEGHYSFYDVPSGTYTLTVSRAGYVIQAPMTVVVP